MSLYTGLNTGIWLECSLLIQELWGLPLQLLPPGFRFRQVVFGAVIVTFVSWAVLHSSGLNWSFPLLYLAPFISSSYLNWISLLPPSCALVNFWTRKAFTFFSILGGLFSRFKCPSFTIALFGAWRPCFLKSNTLCFSTHHMYLCDSVGALLFCHSKSDSHMFSCIHVNLCFLLSLKCQHTCTFTAGKYFASWNGWLYRHLCSCNISARFSSDSISL